jgi:hypothetical protein
MRAGEAFCFSSVSLRKRVTGGYRLRAAHHDTTRSFLFGWLGSTCRRMRSRMADGRRVRAKPVRIVPLRRSRRSRPRPAHRPRRISNCGLRRAGSLRGGHARGADGGHGPGLRACLGRRCQLRRQTVARLVDIVHGGYPCQPFSIAGRKLGDKDPRHLWPHIARIVREIEPRFCFFENVGGHLRLGFEQVHDDLRSMGYRVAAGLFTAEEVGAPHKRERLFILAYAEGAGNHGESRRPSSSATATGRIDASDR